MNRLQGYCYSWDWGFLVAGGGMESERPRTADAVSSLGEVVALVLSVAVITYAVAEILIGVLQ